MSTSYVTTRRRSTSSIIIVDSGEEDLTKTLLASKTPNIISKRRGSASSISSATSSTITTTTTTTKTFSTNSKSIKMKSTTKTTTTTTKSLLPMEIMTIDEVNINDDNDNNNNNDGEDIFHDDLIPNSKFDDFKSKNLNHMRSLSQPVKSLSVSKSLNPIINNVNDNVSYLISSPSNINYDTHSKYKQRTKLTSQKLSNFFGTKPPIDICVKEIEKEGLKAILNSKIPLCYFLYSLLEEYSSENLFFFLEVEQYESKTFDNSTQQLVMAQQIFDTYLTRNSQFEVNIDDKVRKSVIATIKSERDLHHCFRDAKRAVFVLLESSFSRFIRSGLADIMKKQIGQHTAHYSRGAYETAISWLFKYLDKFGPIKITSYINRHHQNGFANNNNISSANQLLQKVLKSINNNISNSDSNSNNNGDIGNHDFNYLTNLSQSLPSPNSLLSEKRNEMIRNMTLEFIINLLEIDVGELYYYELIHKANKNNRYDNDDCYRNDNVNNNSGNGDDDIIIIGNNIKGNNNIIIDNNNDNNMILQDLDDLDMTKNIINSASVEFNSLNQISNYEGWDIDNSNSDGSNSNSNNNNSGGNASNSYEKKRELKSRKSVKDLKNPFKKTQKFRR